MSTNVTPIIEATRALVEDESTVESFQTVLRTYNGGARGVASLAAMTEGQRLGNVVVVLDAVNSLPAVTATRTERLTEEQEHALRGVILDALWDSFASVLGDHNESALHKAAIKAIEAKVIKCAKAAPIGTRSGPGADLSDLLAAGKVAPGAVLVHGDKRAVVNADGSVTYNGEAMNLSKAGRLASGSKAENGYRYWTLNGAKLSTLR